MQGADGKQVNVHKQVWHTTVVFMVVYLQLVMHMKPSL